jgi:hypothetical protein
MTMMYTILAGSTDVSVVIRIIDSTDGTPETGVVFNTSGIDLEYRREGAASTDITEATLAALTTAHTDGGFLHIGNGYYRLDLPDAAVASGASGVLIHGTVTGMVVLGCYIQLVAYNPFDSVRLGLTALPNAAAGANGGLPTGNASGQVAVASLANDSITAAAIATDAIGSAEISAAAVTKIQSGLSTYAGGDTSGTTTLLSRLTSTRAGLLDNLDAAISSRLASASYTAPLDAAGVRSAVGMASANLDTQLGAIDNFLDTEVAAILADTNELQTDWADGGRLDLLLDAAGSAGDPWATSLPGAYGAGTAGKIVGDNINATVGSRATQTSVDTIDDFLDTEVAAIKAKTDNLPTDPADQSAVEAAITAATSGLATQASVNTIDDFLDTEIAAIKAQTDLIPASPAAVGSAMTLSNAGIDAIFDRTDGVETGYTLRQALRIMAAALAGELSGAATTTITIRNITDTKARITAVVDADGNRSSLTLDAS